MQGVESVSLKLVQDDVPEDQADFAMRVGDFNASEKLAFSEIIQNYIEIE